jgi:CheY-like chemotaxis protein
MSKIGIYCIDDDNLINVITKHQISEYVNTDRYFLETFTNPIEAIEEIKINFNDGIQPTVCLIDFQMPEMTGDQVVRKIKESFPDTKCVMLSGNSSASIVSDLVDENLLDYYISKPWSKEELIEKINDCLPPIFKFSRN